MKKILLSITLLFGLLLPVNAFAQDIKIIINNKEIKPDVAPFIENGRTMVPVRTIGEASGMTVSYEPSYNDMFTEEGEEPMMMSVLTSKNGRKIFIDDFYIQCSDGILYTIENPYVIKNNRTFVPIRFISNALNMDINWNTTAKLIELKDSTEDKQIPIYFSKYSANNYNNLEEFKSEKLFIEYKNDHYLINGKNLTLHNVAIDRDNEVYNYNYFLNSYKNLFNGLDLSEYFYFDNNYFLMSPNKDKVSGISAS